MLSRKKHRAAAATLALRFRAKNICWPETLERPTRVKRLIGRPQEALCESEAAATNVLTVRKRSGSNKCFNCAKAKRQQQSAQSERKSTPRYDDHPKMCVVLK